jgi:hypothetical protein
MIKKKVSNMIKKASILLVISMIYFQGISQNCSDPCSEKNRDKKEVTCSKKDDACHLESKNSKEVHPQSCSFSRCLVCPDCISSSDCSGCPKCIPQECSGPAGFCSSDLDGDGQITVLDFLIFLEEFGKAKEEPKPCCRQ